MQLQTLGRTDFDTKSTAHAGFLEDRMNLFRRADNGVGRTALAAMGATNATTFINLGQQRRTISSALQSSSQFRRQRSRQD